MAADKSMTLTSAEMNALADRLLSRGVSKLSSDQAPLKSDLRLAARVIQAVSQDFIGQVTVPSDNDAKP